MIPESEFNLSESYPIALDDSNGERIISDVPQQSLEGIQQELEFPSVQSFHIVL